MDKKAIQKLKKDLLKNKSHDIFKNVQALFDLAYTTNDMELNYTVRKICAEKAKKFKKEKRHFLMPFFFVLLFLKK